MRALYTRAYVLVSFADGATHRWPARLFGDCAVRRGVQALARLAARIPQSWRKVARTAAPPQNLCSGPPIDG